MPPEPKSEPKKVRGVYEHPKGSRIFWIQYFEQGRRRRERVGTKSDAIKLYQKRKTQILQGEKLPELQRKRVTLGELIDDAIAYAKEHNSSIRDYVGKGKLLKPSLGQREAESLRPDELASWIRKREVSPATFNRYRSFLSLCYREGMRNGKVKTNPARLLSQKREPRGRARFLSRDECDSVVAKIGALYPQHRAAFVISVHTGMRLMEQYSLRWGAIDMVRREIHVVKSKNGEERTIPMTSVVHAELKDLSPKQVKAKDKVFPRPLDGEGAVQPRWLNDVLALEDVNVEDYTWHNNRHTFCSWLAIAGVPLRTIQELAGHKTISMTARYAHLSPDHKAAEVEKLVTSGRPKIVTIRSAIRTAIG